MKFANAWTTLIAYSPLPDPAAICDDLRERGFDFEMTRLEQDARSWRSFSLTSSSRAMLVRVVCYSFDGSNADATLWKQNILNQLAMLPDSEDRQLVVDHLIGTTSAVQTEVLELDEGRLAWDCEYLLHGSLCHFSGTGRTDAMWFICDGAHIVFADEVETFLEFDLADV